MAFRLFSKFRKLLDVTWGTPSNRHVPIYNSETDKLIVERIQESDVNGLEASLDALATDIAGKAATAHTHAGTDIISGTLPDARLSSNVALENVANAFTATNTFTGTNAGDETVTVTIGPSLTNALSISKSPGEIHALQYNAATETLTARIFAATSSITCSTGTISAVSFSGSGASLTNLPAGQLTGSIADARLSANVPLINASNTFTGTTNTFSGTTVYVNSVFKLKTSTWHVDGDGNERMYWQASGPFYIKGHGSGAALLVRNASNADIYQVNHDGTMIVFNSTVSGASSRLYVKASAGQSTDLFQIQNNSNAVKVRVDSTFSFVIGDAALATNATTGFPYIPSCAGIPSGTPTAYTGRVAMVYDSTNNKLYVYNGGWKSVTLA